MKYCPMCGGPLKFGQKTVKEGGVKVHLSCVLGPTTTQYSETKYIFPGFWDRFGARVNDGLIYAIPLLVISSILKKTTGMDVLKIKLVSFIDIKFVLGLFYWGFVYWMIATKSQSWGMRFKKIQLLSHTNTKAGFPRIWIRDWFNNLTLGLGNLLILWHPQRKSLADLIFKTKMAYVENQSNGLSP
jgi:uncharacterized RDD family membrane protein YckC